MDKEKNGLIDRYKGNDVNFKFTYQCIHEFNLHLYRPTNSWPKQLF